MSEMPCRVQMSQMRSMSQTFPNTWTTQSALVRSVMRRSMSSGSMVRVSGRMSQNTGVAAQWMMGVALACQV